jgi:hypothetical protein
VTFFAAKKEEEKTNPSKGVAAVPRRKGEGKKREKMQIKEGC